MAWTEITRAQYQREGLRYASDTTDEEWILIVPHLPALASCGRRRKHALREIVNAIFYIAQTGCQWRQLPSEFRRAPHATVLLRVAERGPLADHQPRPADRCTRSRRTGCEPFGRDFDSQSVKTTESGGPRGYAAEKMIKGRKLHVLPDALGLLVGAIVHRADIQDRDGAPLLLAGIRDAFPWLRHVFADGAYSDGKLRRALGRLRQVDRRVR